MTLPKSERPWIVMEQFSSELVAHLTAHKTETRMCRGVKKKRQKKNQFEGWKKKERRCRENSDDFEGRGELVKYEEWAGKGQIRRRKKEIDRQREKWLNFLYGSVLELLFFQSNQAQAKVNNSLDKGLDKSSIRANLSKAAIYWADLTWLNWILLLRGPRGREIQKGSAGKSIWTSKSALISFVS